MSEDRRRTPVIRELIDDEKRYAADGSPKYALAIQRDIEALRAMHPNAGGWGEADDYAVWRPSVTGALRAAEEAAKKLRALGYPV